MRKDIIVVGASAGGVEALQKLVGALPRKFPASMFIVQHMAPQSPSVLALILDRAGEVPVVEADDHMEIKPGRIYVAPPDHHLLIEPGGYLRTTRGPKENRFRPAVDPLFRSAARAYGPRVIGIVLTGGLDDGTAGLWAIKRRGGLAVVQDPEEALATSMPLNAMRYVKIDYCLPLTEMAPLLVRLASEPAEEEGAYPMSDEMEIEVNIARETNAKEAGVMKLGEKSIFTCPECHGALLEMKEGDRYRFRCHTGHAFSISSLLAELTENIEHSLWNSIRSIEESTMLMRHLAEHLNGSEPQEMIEMLQQKAQEAQRRADLVRRAAMSHDKLSEGKVEQETEKASSS